MWFIDKVKGVIQKMFASEAEKAFDVQLSDVMDFWISRFDRISRGEPNWIKDDIKPTGFAGFINEYMAKLVTLNLAIECPDTPRGQYLQEQADYILQTLQNNVSRALGGCGIMFKPNGESIDYIFPDSFAVTDWDSNGNISGAIFQTTLIKGRKYYTRLEYQRFEGDRYIISNRAYVSDREGAIGRPCELSAVEEWANLADDLGIEGLESPLFAFFKNPAANMLENSPLGVPIWVNCLKELEDYDIAWSRKSEEIKDSTHVTFVPQSAVSFADKNKIKLPRYVRGIQGNVNMDREEIRDHVATLLTEQRIADLNATLAAISTKCGLSQSAFVYNEKTGMATATQIEAEEQETIRTVDRIRDALKASLIQLFTAINYMADLYSDLPAEELIEEINFSFDDITANFEEDKTNWWKYVQSGFAPAWKYFVMFEGMSEEDARAMCQEARDAQQQDSLASMFEGKF